ncbi:hypothetical protein [Azospirillum picis]|uniref:Uncharacterized protein n=1 Tax=Azospirillum picis TaxID=488438 RepID=A0ABU0MV11_9PROT|nr:hypothetical protein [Azospirillum picis]MBP2303439.1 hypothetical protein [Azospirillum picis]MDQ0537302.1 hypothetical protein [Azospirillum picis]
MADFSSEGLWDRDGIMMDREDLPISPELSARHLAWCDRYEFNDLYEGKATPSFDLPGFAAEGLAIAKAIKAELPDWTVIYFDEAKAYRTVKTVPRSEVEYEVTGS